MYSEYLKILLYRKKVFRKDLNITETDFAIKVWGPILEAMMQNEINSRLKWGVMVRDLSEAIDTAIDVRVVYEPSEGVNTERTLSIGKIASNPTSLFIENKCIVDKLLNEGFSKKDAIIPCLKLNGYKAILYSVRLVADGLYVGVEEGRCSMMSNANDISSFRRTINVLQTFKRSALNLVEKNNQKNLGSSRNMEELRELRSTWIPPSQNKSKVPTLPQYLLQ